MLIRRKIDANQNYTKEFSSYITENADRLLAVKAVWRIIRYLGKREGIEC